MPTPSNEHEPPQLPVRMPSNEWEPPPETAHDRHWREYERALATATRLAEESASAWDGADRHGMVVTYGDSGVPCHEVAAMFAAQAQAWAAIAAARYLPMQPPGGVV